jgi:copper chaperone
MSHTKTLIVEGMSCEGCSGRLKKLLEKHADVQQAEVSHVDGTATISGSINEADASTIVYKAGFKFKGSQEPS